MPRPPKYASEEERRAARRKYQREYSARQAAASESGLNICYYQPVPPQTQLHTTNHSIGLTIDDQTQLPIDQHAPVPPLPPPPLPSLRTQHQRLAPQSQIYRQSFNAFGFSTIAASEASLGREQGESSNEQVSFCLQTLADLTLLEKNELRSRYLTPEFYPFRLIAAANSASASSLVTHSEPAKPHCHKR